VLSSNTFTFKRTCLQSVWSRGDEVLEHRDGHVFHVGRRPGRRRSNDRRRKPQQSHQKRFRKSARATSGSSNPFVNFIHSFYEHCVWKWKWFCTFVIIYRCCQNVDLFALKISIVKLRLFLANKLSISNNCIGLFCTDCEAYCEHKWEFQVFIIDFYLF